MKSTSLTGLALVLYLLIAVSCKESSSKVNQNTSVKAFTEYLGKPIKSNLVGSVFNSDQLPIKNAKILVSNQSAFTDDSGHFTIKNVVAYENLLTISITKDNFKTEEINLSPKDDTTSVIVTLYKENELSLFWFSKNNHNLPQTSIEN